MQVLMSYLLILSTSCVQCTRYDITLLRITHLKSQTVASMSAGQRKALLFFWTSLKNLPVEGFGGLTSRLYIYKVNETCDRLPTSQTCFYRLCFPPYQSLEVMQDRLSLVTQEHVACSFGTA